MTKILNYAEKLTRLLVFLIGVCLVLVGFVFKSEGMTLNEIGSILVQIGISVVITYVIINMFLGDIQTKMFLQTMRRIMGIRNKNRNLLSELVYLQRPHAYEVLRMNVDFNLGEIKDGLMSLKETTEAKILVLVKNTHYHFTFGTSSEKESKIVRLCLNKRRLDPKNPRDLFFFKDEDEKLDVYKIARQLKKQIYRIYYEIQHPPCMSDLKNEKEDAIEIDFVESTRVLNVKVMFEINLRKYMFYARRKDLSEFNYKPVKLLPLDDDGNEIEVKPAKGSKYDCLALNQNFYGVKLCEDNLRMGDKIIIYYKKKA